MSRIEHLIFLTNEQGQRAQVAALRFAIANAKVATFRGVQAGHRNFDVVERADSEEGYSDQLVARVRNGQVAA